MTGTITVTPDQVCTLGLIVGIALLGLGAALMARSAGPPPPLPPVHWIDDGEILAGIDPAVPDAPPVFVRHYPNRPNNHYEAALPYLPKDPDA